MAVFGNYKSKRKSYNEWAQDDNTDFSESKENKDKEIIVAYAGGDGWEMIDEKHARRIRK